MKYENKNYLEIHPSVIGFLEEVQERSEGYDVYLGGGFIRDLYVKKFGESYGNDLIPKDVDIFIIPTDEDSNERHLHMPAKGYINFSKEAWRIPDMEERGVKKVTGTWYKHLDTADVQFIEYKKHMSVEELTAGMDMTINQCMYSITNEMFVFTDNFIKDHGMELIRCTHDYDVVRMYKRFVRMEDKFWWYTEVNKPELDYEDTQRLAHSVDHEGSFCDADEFDSEIVNVSGRESWE